MTSNCIDTFSYTITSCCTLQCFSIDYITFFHAFMSFGLISRCNYISTQFHFFLSAMSIVIILVSYFKKEYHHNEVNIHFDRWHNQITKLSLINIYFSLTKRIFYIRVREILSVNILLLLHIYIYKSPINLDIQRIISIIVSMSLFYVSSYITHF